MLNFSTAGSGRGTLLGAVLILGLSTVQDASGLWANQPEACESIFVKTAKGVDFAPTADFHGSGFIIQGDVIRGKTATCKVRKRARQGKVITITATCTSDVMVGDTTFRLRVDDPDSIVRLVPGLPELDTKYMRCPEK
jgi:hypothetical protein